MEKLRWTATHKMDDWGYRYPDYPIWWHVVGKRLGARQALDGYWEIIYGKSSWVPAPNVTNEEEAKTLAMVLYRMGGGDG